MRRVSFAATGSSCTGAPETSKRAACGAVRRFHRCPSHHARWGHNPSRRPDHVMRMMSGESAERERIRESTRGGLAREGTYCRRKWKRRLTARWYWPKTRRDYGIRDATAVAVISRMDATSRSTKQTTRRGPGSLCGDVESGVLLPGRSRLCSIALKHGHVIDVYSPFREARDRSDRPFSPTVASSCCRNTARKRVAGSG